MFKKLENKWKIIICVSFLIALVLVNTTGYWASNLERGLNDNGEYWARYVDVYKWLSIDVTASTIIICLFLLILFQNNRRDMLTALALFFAFLIDRFVGYGNQILVVAIYFILQVFCAVRLYLNLNKNQRKLELLLRAGIIILAEVIALIGFKSEFSVLYFFAIFYFANLVMNCITAGLQVKTNAIFFAGIFIFLLSDIFVGLSQLGVFYITNLIEGTYILALLLITLSLVLKPTESESVSVLKD